MVAKNSGISRAHQVAGVHEGPVDSAGRTAPVLLCIRDRVWTGLFWPLPDSGLPGRNPFGNRQLSTSVWDAAFCSNSLVYRSSSVSAWISWVFDQSRRGLGLAQVGLIGILLNQKEELVFLHNLTVVEEDLLQVSCNPGTELHGPDGLGVAEGLDVVGHGSS